MYMYMLYISPYCTHYYMHMMHWYIHCMHVHVHVHVCTIMYSTGLHVLLNHGTEQGYIITCIKSPYSTGLHVLLNHGTEQGYIITCITQSPYSTGLHVLYCGNGMWFRYHQKKLVLSACVWCTCTCSSACLHHVTEKAANATAKMSTFCLCVVHC